MPVGRADAPTFLGHVRPDGSVGTRNEVWILPTVGCVGRLGERLAQRGQAMIAALPDAQIDGVHAFNHPFGCSQLGADLEGTAAILAALACNPNAGACSCWAWAANPTSSTPCSPAFRKSGAPGCACCARNRKAMSLPPAKRTWPICLP
jgi:hypothetical protein